MAKYLDTTGVSTLWGKVKEYGTATASAAVKTITDTKGAKNGIASLDSNGYVPLSQLGNLDTTFAEVVTALPTSNIKKHLYLVKSSDTSQNLYSEYIYTGDTTATYDASKWEKLGEYKADVDLSAYAKKSEALGTLVTAQDSTKATIHKTTVSGSMSDVYITSATSSAAGVMSASDKAKLDGIAANANNYSLPTASASTLGGIKVGSNLSISNGVLSGTADTHYASKTVLASDATSKEQITTQTEASTSKPLYLNHIENNAVKSAIPIAPGSNVGIMYVPGTGIVIGAKDTTYSVATTSANGLMSAADKAKLNTVETSANYYVLPHASSSTLGGVKLGDKMTIDENGALSTTAEVNQNAFSTVTVKSGSTVKTISAGSKTAGLGITATNIDVVTDTDTNTIGVSLTKANVTNALGYTPPTQDTNTYISSLKTTSTTTSVTNTLTMNDGVTYDIVVGEATASHAGLLSTTGFSRLKGIAEGATADSAITSEELTKILV